ncbi:TPA: hypothetical protein ACGSXA_003000 [Escherichia coli]
MHGKRGRYTGISARHNQMHEGFWFCRRLKNDPPQSVQPASLILVKSYGRARRR